MVSHVCVCGGGGSNCNSRRGRREDKYLKYITLRVCEGTYVCNYGTAEMFDAQSVGMAVTRQV